MKVNQESIMKLLYRRVNGEVKHPVRATGDSVGLDVHAISTTRIESLQTQRVSTGLTFCIPEGHYLRVAGRSGLACKGILVHGGVVDRDYTGIVNVIISNISGESYEISEGDRIAQVVLERASIPETEEEGGKPVEILSSARGERGFGSSGR